MTDYNVMPDYQTRRKIINDICEKYSFVHHSFAGKSVCGRCAPCGGAGRDPAGCGRTPGLFAGDDPCGHRRIYPDDGLFFPDLSCDPDAGDSTGGADTVIPVKGVA